MILHSPQYPSIVPLSPLSFPLPPALSPIQGSSPNTSYRSGVLDDNGSSFRDGCGDLRSSLLNVFDYSSSDLKVCHINAQSIPAHYAEILTSFQGLDLHALLVSESWLKPTLPSSGFAIQGYSLLRNDRVQRRGGGVCIYLRDDLSYDILHQSTLLSIGDPEFIFIKVNFHHRVIVLGVVYCPPMSDYFAKLEPILESLSASYSDIIMMGDFNTCTMRGDTRATRFGRMISNIHLNRLHLQPTHVLQNSQTSIDHIIVSKMSMVKAFGQVSAAGFSHHDLIYVQYTLKVPKRKSFVIESRCLRRIDNDALVSDARRIDWDNVADLTTVEQKVAVLSENIVALYNKHAPVRKIRVKNKIIPWFNDEIKSLMLRRDRARIRHKHSPSEENWLKFKGLRNACTKLCRNAKMSYYHDLFTNCSQPVTWKRLDSSGLTSRHTAREPIGIDSDILNAHFAAPPVILDDVKKYSTIHKILSVPRPLCPCFVLSAVSDSDVKRILLSIKSKAVGIDDIDVKFLSPFLDLILPALTHTINSSIKENHFPSDWKRAVVIPLLKNNKSRSSPSDYRPISILPFFSKVLEKVVFEQLNSYLSINNLLNPFQSGFRAGHSTTTALVKITDDIRRAMDAHELTHLTLLDFSSAFNSVDFEILLATLSSMNVSNDAVKWFRSYLTGRFQCVRGGPGSLSGWEELVMGVPQGGILSPLLFSIFINSITRQIPCKYHLYADDLQIYSHFKLDDISTAVDNASACLTNISEWASENGLLLNPTKSQCLIIGSHYSISRLGSLRVPATVMNGQIIPYTSTAKNLGLIMDQRLSWQQHVDSIKKRFYCSFHNLRLSQRFLPMKTKTLLVQALLLPLLDYADIAFLDLNQNLLDCLERLQNMGIRYIFNLKKYDHITEYRNKLKWLTIRQRRDSHILTLLHKVLYTPFTPYYLKEMFEFLASHGLPLRSNNERLLSIPSHGTRYFSHSFSVHGARCWNELSSAMRTVDSHHLLKNMIRNKFLAQNLSST
jgi:exonuclease III